MGEKLLKQQICAAAALLVAAAVCILLLRPAHAYLTLESAQTGQVYAAYPIRNGSRFSVTFVHSVNKSPVTDIYEVRNGTELYVVETDYYGFGAGVQTELNPGETLSYGDDGAMRVQNIDQLLPKLIYVVGTVSDHTLEINGQTISLRDLCGQNTSVHFFISQQ